MNAHNGDTVRETILVIDDERDILTMLKISLESSGYTVHIAQSGIEGLDAYARHRDEIDLIILDIKMPEMDGLEVCRALRADSASAHIPVIMVTARSEETDVVAGLDGILFLTQRIVRNNNLQDMLWMIETGDRLAAPFQAAPIYVFESTNVFWRAQRNFLHRASYATATVCGRQTKHARSTVTRKTHNDLKDAYNIAKVFKQGDSHATRIFP